MLEWVRGRGLEQVPEQVPERAPGQAPERPELERAPEQEPVSVWVPARVTASAWALASDEA
ncbi:hypothetical protein [Arthrobacter pityocampae]|uniref:hypothetical protein n=1 Tax=Arthrobacter pityocampae TaxID=547334 RepID=UPI00142DF2B1|nr:hypothetical protein [Arthrobacter pityocampae]